MESSFRLAPSLGTLGQSVIPSGAARPATLRGPRPTPLELYLACVAAAAGLILVPGPAVALMVVPAPAPGARGAGVGIGSLAEAGMDQANQAHERGGYVSALGNGLP